VRQLPQDKLIRLYRQFGFEPRDTDRMMRVPRTQMSNGSVTKGPTMQFLPAHHGTPHKIDPEEGFKLEKIGTGEGAQAYGWGLYYAENPEVSTEYRKTLSNPRGLPLLDGVPFEGYGMDVAEYDGVRTLGKYNGDVEKAIAAVKAKADEYGINWTDKSIQKRIATIKEYAGRVKHEDEAGYHYTVDIDAPPEDFLDWDKPLSEQSEKVKDALSKAGIPNVESGTAKGEQVYRFLGQDTWNTGTKTPSEASDFLKKLGIVGIRYFDQGSRLNPKTLEEAKARVEIARRDAEDAPSNAFRQKILADEQRRLDELEKEQQKNTSNFVVFDEKIIRITHENGEPVTPKERRDALGQPNRAEDTKEAARKRQQERELATAQ